MDLGSSFTLLSPEPIEHRDEHLVWTTGAGYLALPARILPAAALADWVIERPDLPLAFRVEALLAAEREAPAWRLVGSLRGALGNDASVLIALEAWAARRAQALALPSASSGVILLGAPPGDLLRRQREVGGALQDVRDLLDGCPWPRWAGPLLVLLENSPCADLPAGQAMLARPALPILRLPAGTPPDTLREATARALAHLVLSLARHPERDWPAWLSVGLEEVTAARARGEGPSPRTMLVRRRELGAAELRAMLRAEERTALSPEAALALAAPLCHTLRRRHLGSLLDLLRNGIGGEAALEIAYGLSIESLLTRR